MTTKTSQSFVKGYKYEIRPTDSQKDYMAKAFGHCRFVWNQTLSQLKDEYDAYIASGTAPTNRDKTLRPRYDFTTLSSRLTVLKTIYPWLYEVSSVALQQTIRHLSQAYDSFFKAVLKSRKVGLPRFKSKFVRQSISLMTNGFSLDTNDLYIAKVSEPLKVLWSKDLPSSPTSMTLTKESNGRYYVSFVCQYSPPKTSGTGIVGIDLGVKSLYTDSNGHKEDSLVKFLEPIETQIKRLQRHLSRKVKGTISYSRLKRRLASWHLRLRNVRNDILHKLSRRLVDENQVIVLETLAVANMVNNHHLARSISMSSWSKLVQYLVYKSRESQHTLVAKAGRFYPSSKACHVCGVINYDLRLKDRKWTCESCQTTHDRDDNASLNLKGLFVNWVQRTHPDLSDYAGSIVLL